MVVSVSTYLANDVLCALREKMMTQTLLKIDIVSDVMCPWCAIGYAALDRALEQLSDTVKADIHWQPFELNPDMPAEGQHLGEHLAQKYGSTPEQSKENRDRITQMGAELDFEFNFRDDQRIVNTFDAHQLLHWIGEAIPERQTELKMALFHAYFRDGLDVSKRDVLMGIVAELDLDAEYANKLLQDQTYAGDVRALQQQWRQLGVQAVPVFIINEKYMLSGGQPVEAFVQALQQIAAQPA